MNLSNRYPERQEAEAALAEAAKSNPGNWVSHSRYAALACENIAKYCPDLDPEKAYVLGLLHDIGRYVGIVRERHQLEGYRYCMRKGWDAVAKICLTHTYVLKDATKKKGNWDIPSSDYEFVKNFIETAEYDDYDRLVQFCDCLSLPTGFCIVEKRLVDVGIRYGVDEYTVEQWKKVIELKAYFENKTGVLVYKLLPGICDNMLR